MKNTQEHEEHTLHTLPDLHDSLTLDEIYRIGSVRMKIEISSLPLDRNSNGRIAVDLRFRHWVALPLPWLPQALLSLQKNVQKQPRSPLDLNILLKIVI